MSSHLFFFSVEFLLTAGSQERGISYEEVGKATCAILLDICARHFQGKGGCTFQQTALLLGAWEYNGIEGQEFLSVLFWERKTWGGTLFFGPDAEAFSLPFNCSPGRTSTV